MGFGGSFSKLLEKVKHPAPKGRRRSKSERRESAITDEKVDLRSPVTRPKPRVVAGDGDNKDGNGVGANGTKKDLTLSAGVEEKSVSTQEEVDEKKVVPPIIIPPISHNEKPTGISAKSSPPSSLTPDSTPLSGNVETTMFLDHVKGALDPEPDLSDQDEPNSSWKFSAFATAKLFLCEAKESANAPAFLKVVVAGLCFILENGERNKADKQAIEVLAPKVKALSVTLCTPVLEGDDKEATRRKELDRKLESFFRELEPLVEQGKVEGFFNNVKNADKLDGLIGDIQDVVVTYRTSLQQAIDHKNRRLIESTDLALLSKMRLAAGAEYRYENRPGCLRGTRKDVLSQIDQWLSDKKNRRAFWLSGQAGTGKSTIAQTLAETTYIDGKLGASFFCSRDFEDRSNLRTIFPTLAFQLAHRYPSFRRELLQALGESAELGRESLCSQMEKFIVGPLKAARIQTLIIIDAIDECKDEEPASALLSILSRYVHEIPGVKFFITGRPEPRIQSGFRLPALKPITEVLNLHDVEQSSVNDDIKLFLRTRLRGVARSRRDHDFTKGWPDLTDIDTLSKKAAGSFLYASTVVKFVESDDLPTTRLSLIISPPQDAIDEGKSDTGTLYTQILERASSSAPPEDEGFYHRFKSVVGAALLTFVPLPTDSLSTLLRAPEISTTLRSLNPLLVSETDAEPVRVFHKSFPDFLTDQGQCKDERFFVNPSLHHREILLSCLSLMKERLRKNICGLDDHVSFADVEDLPARRKTHIGDALEYACRFWTRHLLEVPTDGHDVEEIHKAIEGFFTTQLLYWIEVLCLTGNLDISVRAIDNVYNWYTSAGATCKWTYDARRFLLESLDIVHQSPSKVYHHALPFSPSSSWLHECYSPAFLQEVNVVKGLPVTWGACSQTLLFDHFLQVLTCWKDVVAVGSMSGDIRILDGVTGTCVSTLSRHTDSVEALTFSPDGALLLSGSNDKTINLWDIQTGGVVRTFRGHTEWVWSVSISPDCEAIASGSGDTTVRVWDLCTGECLHVISGHNSYITSLGFSTTSRTLISASVDGTVYKWDVEGHQSGSAYPGYGVALSFDGSLFISWDQEGATVRNSDSGVTVAELRVDNSIFQRCCFSPDDKLVACAAGEIIYVWDITSSDPCLFETLLGHTKDITSIAFSSPSLLISTSDDKSVRSWQIRPLSLDPVPSDPKPTPSPSTPIRSISLQTADGIAISSDSDGVVKTWDISTGLCKASFHTPVDTNSWRDVCLVDGKLTAAWFTEEGIYIWDIERSEVLHTVRGSFDYPLSDFRISGDKSKVICVDEKSIQAWSIQTGEAAGEVKLEHKPHLHSLVLDGSKVWVHFKDSPTQGWDFGTADSSPTPLSDTSPERPHLDFIDGTKGWNTSPSRVEDTVAGKEVFHLPRKIAEPVVSQWDGQHLVAGYESGEVFILDFAHMFPQ